ncbi:MAG: hypothetical protein KDB23_01935 [Planctomycetales bacterium]|nr:hypothetical protein [Planctomycetales bacterium]
MRLLTKRIIRLFKPRPRGYTSQCHDPVLWLALRTIHRHYHDREVQELHKLEQVVRSLRTLDHYIELAHENDWFADEWFDVDDE